MKKFYTLTAALLFGAASLFAQEKIQLGTKNAAGEFVPAANNAVITQSTLVPDEMGMGDDFISSGLFVKNTTDAALQTLVEYEIKTMPFGKHDICYKGSCLSKKTTGKYTYPDNPYSSKGNIINVTGLGANEETDLRAEWYNGAQAGSAEVVYTAHALVQDGTETIIVAGKPQAKPKYKVVESTTVTIKYVYDPTGIKDAVLHDQVVKTEFYDITGKQIAEPKSGLFIKKSYCVDGSVKTRKVVK